MFLYYRYSDYLLKKYGTKVYKLPVHLPLTCPNRENGQEGCSYCGDYGTGFENRCKGMSVKDQIAATKIHIQKNYKAEKFIAYFQNYTNTYLSIDEFYAYMKEAVEKDIVELCISTRPDALRKEYLDVLQEISRQSGLNISIELGLQTANYHTLQKVNRGHSLAEFIDACLQVMPYQFPVCAHVILNLPWDTMEDVIETAKFVSSLKVTQVKLHALYLVQGSRLWQQYENGEFELLSLPEYKERAITFLEYISPEIVVQRLLGRIPKEFSAFSNWNMSWWKIRDEIEQEMLLTNRKQGDKFDYLGGKAVSQFFK